MCCVCTSEAEKNERETDVTFKSAIYVNIRVFCLFLFVIMCCSEECDIIRYMDFLSSLSAAPVSGLQILARKRRRVGEVGKFVIARRFDVIC